MEGLKLIEIYKEIISLLTRVDNNYASVKEDMHMLSDRIKAIELENGAQHEDIKRLKQSIMNDFQEIDRNFEKWDKIWSKNKNYVLFAVTLGTIGASATLGFDFVIEIFKKFLGIK